MPSATARKSAAYEKGVREGRADKMKKPKIEISPEGEEESEGPDKEEEMDGAASHSRKRSAHGAKHTKAPMDAEGCACGGKGRKGKAACDGTCGKAMKDGSYAKQMDRSDALTPQEYLVACELGIQSRSRPYIRARLDATERLDKKCGASGIPDNKKCNVGTGKSKAKGSSLGTALKVIGTGTALATAATIGTAMYQNHQRPEGGTSIRRRTRRQGRVTRLNAMYADGFAVDLKALVV